MIGILLISFIAIFSKACLPDTTPWTISDKEALEIIQL